MNKKAFGKFVKKHREEKFMTQNDLAEALHVSPKTVSAWERGQSYPDLEGLEELCTVLDVTVQQAYDESQGSTSKININVIAIAIVAGIFLFVGGGIGIKNLVSGAHGGQIAPVETSPQPTGPLTPTGGDCDESHGDTNSSEQPTIGMPLERGCYRFVGWESVDLAQDVVYHDFKIYLDSDGNYMMTLMHEMSYAPNGHYEYYQDGDVFYLHLIEDDLYFEVTYHNLCFLPEKSSKFPMAGTEEFWKNPKGPNFEFSLLERDPLGCYRAEGTFTEKPDENWVFYLTFMENQRYMIGTPATVEETDVEFSPYTVGLDGSGNVLITLPDFGWSFRYSERDDQLTYVGPRDVSDEIEWIPGYTVFENCENLENTYDGTPDSEE